MRRATPTRLKILDFDIESRPLAVRAPAGKGAIIPSWETTAIAAKWVGEDEVFCFLLGEMSQEEIHAHFLELYDEANMVVGHFIRGFDLPRINSMLFELGQSPLGDKVAHDTKLDLVQWDGIGKSQEAISDYLGIPFPKIQMGEVRWREANRLGEKGLSRTYERVTGDVLQNEAMYAALKELGYLKLPVVWRSVRSGISGSYSP